MADNKKKNQSSAGVTVIFIFVGFLAGILISRHAEKLEAAGISGLPAMFINILWFFLSYIIGLIIHEAGHMVMGMLTGYEFLSFRIGSFTIMKENGRLVRKKFSVPGTAGQCLLAPRETDNPEDYPFFWYNFGGVFFNLLTAAAALPLAILADNVFLASGAAIFAAAAIAIALINGIPAKINLVCNDGYNIRIMMKDPAERKVVYKSFLINARLCRGDRAEDMQELFICTREEWNTEHGKGLALSEGTLYMYLHRFSRAEEIFRSVAENESATRIYRLEAKCELMFCLIMLGAEHEKIAGLYDKELQRHITATGRTMICRKRLMYAYYLLTEKSAEKAQAEYDAALKMEKTYPAKGEYLSEIDLINYIKNESLA